MNIAIIGGGATGNSILSAFKFNRDYRIIGLYDPHREAVGMKSASLMGIPTFSDLGELLRQSGLEAAIETTGNETVLEQARALKPGNVSLIDSSAAYMMASCCEAHNNNPNQNQNKKLAFQTSAPFLTKTYGNNGVIYFTTNTECYDFVQAHNLDIKVLKAGERLVQGGVIQRCIRNRQAISELVPRNVYGILLHLWVAPLFQDDDESKPVVGTYGVFAPKLHPVEAAFDIFAPIIIDSQPEGAWVGVTDLEKIVNRMGSEKFDLKDFKVGTPLTDGDTGSQTIKARRKIQQDLRTKKFGNIRMFGIPLYDEETGEMVGTFGITVPRNLARDLQEMASKLSVSTSEVASVMQEIAASAGEINITEGRLADLIKEVRENAASISEIVGFTKSVADQTKMLGLNAAIEAARAGEHGRGFGVVAEEIRKLSDESKKTADEISVLIKQIDGTVQGAVNASQNTVKQSQEQAAATQQVTASVSEMAQMAERLIQLAKSI